MDSSKQRPVIRGAAIGALVVLWGATLAIILNIWALGLIVALLGLVAFERVARGRADPEKLAVMVMPTPSSPQRDPRSWRTRASARPRGDRRAHPTSP